MAFSIRELESLSGIKAHTIRIWEQRYHFLKPSRTQTNIRSYSNDELKTILTVALLNKYGYRISRIDQMQPLERNKAVLELPHPDAQNESLVNSMIGHMIDLESIAFEALLDEQISRNGIEKTVTGIIFYFLEKVGILWQTSRIAPVQEHIVSNIIRQKIIAAIEQLPPVHQSEPLFLLFLPEGEHHEMGLLFVYFLLRKRQLPVIYLGANVPLKDIHYIVQAKKPRYLYLHLTSFPRRHSFHKYLRQLTEMPVDAILLVSGAVTQALHEPVPSAHFLTSLSAVTSYISSVPS